LAGPDRKIIVAGRGYRAYHCLLDLTYTFGEVTIGPEALAPQKLFEFWELGPEDAAGATFEPEDAAGATFEQVDDCRDALRRTDLDEQMHMVVLDRQLMDLPVLDLGGLAQQGVKARGHGTDQHTPPVLGNPHKMHLQAVLGMGVGPVSRIILRSVLPLLPMMLGFDHAFDYSMSAADIRF
jgi:hypothetical protein